MGRRSSRDALRTTRWGRMKTRRYRLFMDPAIREIAPSFVGLVVYVDGVTNGPSDGWSDALLRTAAERVTSLPGVPEAHPHMRAWSEVYRRFGARPKLYKNGCLALANRTPVPRINVLVDLYNSVAMSQMLPIGGEDWDTLQSNLLRTRALGHEEFSCSEACSSVECPQPGEPVWLDRAGVTTRRFNWRQARRTRITLETRAAYFVLDAVAPYDQTHVEAAAARLVELVRQRWPRAGIEVAPLSALTPASRAQHAAAILGLPSEA